jgi:RecB family endonuclease NucS
MGDDQADSQLARYLEWCNAKDAERELRGKGYAWKDDTNERIYLKRCFHCGLENWALMVARGTCAWCGQGVEKQ